MIQYVLSLQEALFNSGFPTESDLFYQLSVREVLWAGIGGEGKKKSDPLEGRSLKILVGMAGFEPAPPASEVGASRLTLCADQAGRHPGTLFDGYAAEEARLGL